jgi:hypothetical protein
MEKDIDEVGKIARMAKTKVDELEKDVCHLALLANGIVLICHICVIFCFYFMCLHSIYNIYKSSTVI